MEEEEKENSQPQSAEENNPSPEKSKISGIAIVGYNILALAFYTLLIRVEGRDGALILDAFILFIHVFLCVGMAISRKSWAWVLSGVLVLAIGFSTCIMIGSE